MSQRQWTEADWLETIEPITGTVLSCEHCRHMNRETWISCAAFPERIPFDMEGNPPAHFKPIHFEFIVGPSYRNAGEVIQVDDHGILFEPLSDKELTDLVASGELPYR